MTQWNIDASHSSADFTVKHMMISTVRGSFSVLSGTINFDPENPGAASVEANIDVSSIDTGSPDRDTHLRSADFFNVEANPSIIFKSTGVSAASASEAKLTGDLTIAGVTRPVTLDVEFNGTGKNPYGMTVAGFAATTKINREDFGLTWNVALEAGGVLVSKEVKIELDIQAVLATETANA